MKPITLNKFLGLANTQPEPRLPLGSLIQADSVLVSDSNGLIAAPGYTKLLDLPIQGSYAPLDQSCLFLVAGGDLMRFDGTTFTVLASGLPDSPIYWCEESGERVFAIGAGIYAQIDKHGEVTNLNTPQPTEASLFAGSGNLPEGRAAVTFYYTNGVLVSPAHDGLFAQVPADGGLMLQVKKHDGWRAEVFLHHERTGAFQYVGSTEQYLAIESLQNLGEPINEVVLSCQGLPGSVSAICFHQSRIVLAEPLVGARTRIHFSVPFLFHLFDREDWFELPDAVTGLCSVDGALLITCKSSIWLLSAENTLTRIADYGTPVGMPITKVSPHQAHIWTTRGLARFDGQNGFVNTTQEVVSVPPGNGCATALLEWSGDSYTLAMTDGAGTAYNANFEV